MRFPICVAALALVVSVSGSYVRDTREEKIDKGDYYLICKQEPADIGIVLDSSASINVGSIYNYKKGLDFLQTVIGKFDIGPGRQETRVSIIPFAKGIYTDESFDLDTYNTKAEVLDAISKIKYMSGTRTDTNMGLDYLYQHLLAPDVTRDYAEKIGIVLTDGDSFNKAATAQAAQNAREAGITMYAVGVGNVHDEELMNIAGNMSRVVKATSYDELEHIVDVLLKKTCHPKKKPTTTLPPPTTCGEDYPADINFVFSPSDLGLDLTSWSTHFIRRVIHNEDFEIGFRYGIVSGSCPEDAGFHLNRYDNVPDISRRLLEYERDRMVDLVEQVKEQGFQEEFGGRSDAEHVVVLLVTEDNYEGIQEEVNNLLEEGIKVYVVDPTDSGNVSIEGATLISGEHPVDAANQFVSTICHLG